MTEPNMPPVGETASVCGDCGRPNRGIVHTCSPQVAKVWSDGLSACGAVWVLRDEAVEKLRQLKARVAELETENDGLYSLYGSEVSRRDEIILSLRRKLAEAGIEGSPPPGVVTTIQRWKSRVHSAEARASELEKEVAQCVKQEVSVSPDGRTAVFVERRGQRDGSFLWAIRDSFGAVLDKSGTWWVEPPASDRSDEYLASTRWSMRAEAVAAARAAQEVTP